MLMVDESAEVKRHYEHLRWVLTDGGAGIAPGSFTTHLLRALLTADRTNFLRLKSLFPAEARAVELWRHGEP